MPSLLYQEKDMDLLNNEIGIIAGQNNTDLSNLADEVYQKMLIGELKYLMPLDYTQSPRYDPINNPSCTYCRNGFVPGLTELKPTNQ